jgi:hypothetical protein
VLDCTQVPSPFDVHIIEYFEVTHIPTFSLRDRLESCPRAVFVTEARPIHHEARIRREPRIIRGLHH